MQKKKSKKSWQRHQKQYCFCYICEGNWFARFLLKTRVRQKFFKNEQKF
jgi:hypothetical protein